jgi:hypothetical protein
VISVDGLVTDLSATPENDPCTGPPPPACPASPIPATTARASAFTSWSSSPSAGRIPILAPAPVLRSLRCLGERGFAELTQRWRILQHVTASPSKISDVARARLVVMHFENGHIK